jgi:hypothetical protein
MLVHQPSTVKFGFIYYKPLSDKLDEKRRPYASYLQSSAPPLPPIIRVRELSEWGGGGPGVSVHRSSLSTLN